MELKLNNIPVVAIISMNESDQLVESIRTCAVNILTLKTITGEINDWHSSPDVIVFDKENLPNWKDDWEKLKKIEAFQTAPVILITNKKLSLVDKIRYTKDGIFGFNTYDNWDNLSCLCTSALIQGKKNKENLLQSNELNRILSTNYLVIDAKNSQLEKVKKELETINKNTDNKVKKELEIIIKEIENNLKKEHHYQLFKVHFEEVHPLFYKKLLNTNPKLTDNNLKLLAFLKMGFNNDEISFLLNISMSAVKKSVQRLKQKLNIMPENSLREFIFNIDT